ncbi:DUF6321 domain-containing protein [Tunturiibacter gelidoferens]|uniref:DUF6321 domain-containing protein n=1 Tax=Tunturiibacter gelidiferens TaxID=3069689 RepID=A0AAU7Z6T0_9BACT
MKRFSRVEGFVPNEEKRDVKKRAVKKASSKSMRAKGKDPKGGLTAAGREFYKKTEGANLKPGVKGKADTPEKMRRKGSF